MKIHHLYTVLVLLASPLSLPASSDTDRKIEDAAKASYNYRTVLDDKIMVKAEEGIVTLTGTVHDKNDKALAGETAGNLPGVKGVNNKIVVSSKYPEKSDAWIALKIRGRLLVKANVSASATKVAVLDGIVTLSGTADNEAQKELSTAYAKDIDGVKSVINNLVVQAGATPSSTVGEKIDDASITAQVKFALLDHKSTSALKTKITTNEGVIVITGEAASDAEKSLVTKLAGDVRGVTSVNNQMTVKP